MTYAFYSFLHIASMFLFVAMTQRALAAPKARESKPLRITAVVGVIGFVAAFGLLARTSVGWPGWVIAKLVIWIAIAAIPGIVKSKPELAPKMTMVVIALVVAAVYLVVFRPF